MCNLKYWLWAQLQNKTFKEIPVVFDQSAGHLTLTPGIPGGPISPERP